jgi:hypothetical protein
VPNTFNIFFPTERVLKIFISHNRHFVFNVVPAYSQTGVGIGARDQAWSVYYYSNGFKISTEHFHFAGPIVEMRSIVSGKWQGNERNGWALLKNSSFVRWRNIIMRDFLMHSNSTTNLFNRSPSFFRSTFIFVLGDSINSRLYYNLYFYIAASNNRPDSLSSS